ncbi:hypothetical protein KVT40_000168 [Elsinoe batatas]|uniref:Fork-head domain-containing protein n=1 Tax=Elsinoe batatas TaxID=2601811 RepID=A0A8K0LF38_9PEZI|nr:hypothetical protein KVT40_000168 [Elsinoe batatas]
MASTRRATPLDIYQDPVTYQYHGDVEAELYHALSQENQSRQNIILQPSSQHQSLTSPRKAERQTSSPGGPLGGRSLNSVCIPPPVPSTYKVDSPTKNSFFYHTQQPMMPSVPSSDALFGAYPAQMDKENMFQVPSFDYGQQYPGNMYGHKAPLKRGYQPEAMLPPTQKVPSSNKKVKIEEAPSFVLPDPSEMPEVDDDGTKPPISYANLIGMAILRAPNRRLTLAQIYKWISDHYKFYRVADTGWQNSIRHNLSLNKNFIKQERPKDDPGKGNYWIIKPGEEKTFMVKDRPIRPIKAGDSTFVQATQHDFYKNSSTPAVGSFTLAPSSAKRFDSKAVDSSKFPDDNLSSDGTLPASDPALGDEDQDASSHHMPPPASRNIRSSPPAEDIKSSPPPLHDDREDTPPKQNRAHGRKTDFGSRVNDSGYYSSIESSVPRGPGYANVMPTSEADRPRHGGGRAEDEIARIRSSSYDSPSKEHGHRRKISVQFDLSSPKRQQVTRAAPATPAAVIFKRPALPPPSISPNTNLKHHRERMQKLLGDSPSKVAMSPLRDSWSNWSPHFSNVLENDFFMSPEKSNNMTPWRDSIFGTSFQPFDFDNDDLASRGSPDKRRPTITRAVTSTGILADITGNTLSRATASATSAAAGIDSPFALAYPAFEMTPNSIIQKSPVPGMSPVKRISNAGLPSESCPEWLDLNIDSLFGGMSPSRNNSVSKEMTTGAVEFNLTVPSDASEEGFDIMQDFGKIGAQQRFAGSNGSPVKARGGRPPLGRSVTSRF